MQFEYELAAIRRATQSLQRALEALERENDALDEIAAGLLDNSENPGANDLLIMNARMQAIAIRLHEMVNDTEEIDIQLKEMT